MNIVQQSGSNIQEFNAILTHTVGQFCWNAKLRLRPSIAKRSRNLLLQLSETPNFSKCFSDCLLVQCPTKSDPQQAVTISPDTLSDMIQYVTLSDIIQYLTLSDIIQYLTYLSYCFRIGNEVLSSNWKNEEFLRSSNKFFENLCNTILNTISNLGFSLLKTLESSFTLVKERLEAKCVNDCKISVFVTSSPAASTTVSDVHSHLPWLNANG